MIPVCEPALSDLEVANVLDCVRSGWISSQGKYIGQLEEAFASFHGVRHAVALCNGTAALETSLHGVGVDVGDEVIIPSFTIISLALAIVRIGAIPRFVDVDERTWNIDPTRIEKLIGPKTRAMIVVHSFGHPADMGPLIKIAERHGMRLIEDTAEALASRYRGKLCGTFGDVASFSLYANKLITTGEGGIIITNNDEVAARARHYINLYFGTSERFSHSCLGYNFRMTNVQAAIGLAQIQRIDEFAERKRQIGRWYADALRFSKVAKFQETVGDVDHVYWMYSVTLQDHLRLDAISAMEHLAKNGIGTRPLFKGLHLQKPLRKYLAGSDEAFPVTERLYKRGFYLPSSINLTLDQVLCIVDRLEELA